MADNESSHIIISPNVLYLLLAGTALGGGGLSAVVGPQLERSAIEACYDNSQIALDVAAQHGQELVDIRRLLLERTRYRFTSEDAEKARRTQARRDEAQDRRLIYIEREIITHSEK